VPGLFSFRARVILRANGLTRPIQRLPVRGMVPTFPHPEPPPLFSASGSTPFPGGLTLWLLRTDPGCVPAPPRLCASRFWLWPRAALGRARGSWLKSNSRLPVRLSSVLGLGSNDNVCATVEKVKHPVDETFFIPSRIRGYAIFGPHVCPEFRHDSCNTAPI
jgi:hypothetical protein